MAGSWSRPALAPTSSKAPTAPPAPSVDRRASRSDFRLPIPPARLGRGLRQHRRPEEIRARGGIKPIEFSARSHRGAAASGLTFASGPQGATQAGAKRDSAGGSRGGLVVAPKLPDSFEKFGVGGIPQTPAVQVGAELADGGHQLAGRYSSDLLSVGVVVTLFIVDPLLLGHWHGFDGDGSRLV